jgi:predicted amidohydrolase YtcJ
VTTTLFRGGTIRLPGSAFVGDWAIEADGRIEARGTEGEGMPGADRVVDLEGGALVTGFCDGHVHLPVTGLYLTGLDFRGEGSASAILEAFRKRASKGGSDVLFGGNFEDPLDAPLSGRDLDDAVGERPALLARADMHSCVVSSALLRALQTEGLPGVDRDDDGEPTGYLREQAAAEAWKWFDGRLTPDQQRAAVRAAAAHAYSKGVTEVHEMFVVEWRGWPAADVLTDTVDSLALEVVVYLGTKEVERVAALGKAQIGGDFFLDGSFGSHTAWMSAPYTSAPPAGHPETGIAYRTDEEVLELFTTGQERGLQVGVHAIGDAAIEQCIAGWESVAESAGLEAVKGRGHRIEHFECASDDHIKRAARLGLRASVQPAFDHYWGGSDGLYARRIGWDRAREMNRFKSMAEAGMVVGAGSDSTVTPLDPFLQMHALRTHHVENERFGAAPALYAHTAGTRALRPGPVDPLRADLAWLDRDPVETDAHELRKTEVVGTWIEGRRVFPAPEAEVE